MELDIFDLFFAWNSQFQSDLLSDRLFSECIIKFSMYVLKGIIIISGIRNSIYVTSLYKFNGLK